MKKIGILALLLGALLLSGCRRELEAKELDLGVPGLSAAVFTGVTEDGLGEGTLEFDGWTYTGTFRLADKKESGALLSGTAESFPCTLVLAGEDVSGVYTGPMEGLVPHGQGAFKAEGGLTYTGEVFGQAAVAGTVENLPYTVAFCDSRYEGLYTGPVENGLPEGESVFQGVNGAGQLLCWDGGWTQGAPSGAGELTAERLLTSIEGAERTGFYQGAGLDGLPAGTGRFSSVTGDGISFTYEGEWANGLMEGRGTLTYAAENRYVRTGTFLQGCFTPTWIEALSVLGTVEPVFTVSQAHRAFLEAHPELWEAESRTDYFNSEYTDAVERNKTLWTCWQKPETVEEPGWIRVNTVKVLDAYVGPAFEGGPVITRITAAERNYEVVLRIIVPGTVENIACNQWVSFIGLPFARSRYTTVLGDSHDCLVFVAGDLTITG